MREIIDYGIEIEEAKVRRKHTYTEEYGEMSSEDRMRVINECKFHVDPMHLKGNHVIFIDDCRISGAHERGIERMISEYNIDISHSHLYYAALTSDNIPTNIEDEINNFSIKGISEILDLIFHDEFVYNTRVVKKILRSSPGDIDRFMNALINFNHDWGIQMLNTLLTLATLNVYHKDVSMHNNIETLIHVLFSPVNN